MKLQILVPQWQEDDKVIKPLLDSIELQQGVNLAEDISVIIVNDGSDVHLSKKLLSKYSFKIDYYLHDHVGVSAIRNICLDYATADYVMFCDADDMFYSCLGLYMIFENIKNGFDTFTSVFFEDIYVNGSHYYKEHADDITFVHGKVHRRQYLIDNNIRWKEELTLHEDSYFNTLARLCTSNVVYSTSPFYLWKYNEKSETRSTPQWVAQTYEHFIKSNDYLISELTHRHKFQYAQINVVNLLYLTYVYFHQPGWIDVQTPEHRKLICDKLSEFYFKYGIFYVTASEDIKSQIMTTNKSKILLQDAENIEMIPFDDWIKMVTSNTKQEQA